MTVEAQQALTLADREQDGLAALEHVLGSGDISQLTNRQRVGHYLRLCRSLGLSELSRPFDWLWFKEAGGEEKLVLYPNQSATAQLRRLHHMRIELTRKEVVGELFVVEAKATTPDGRYDVSSKYVPLTNKYGKLTGQYLANAMMKAETGAKRRVTLSMIGLSLPPAAGEAVSWRPAIIDGTGRIVPNPTEQDKALAADPTMARTIGEPVFEDLEIDEDELTGQAPRPEELVKPKRDPAAPRPTFGMDERRALGAWSSIVRDTYLADDDARHAFVRAWTEARWPAAARTESLRTFFRRATEPQATEFLAHVRNLCEIEQANAIEPLPEPLPEPFPDPVPDPVPEPVPGAVAPAGPYPETVYSRAELFAFYDDWAAYMRALDSAWTPENVRRVADTALRRKVDELVATARDLAAYLERADEAEESAEAF